MRTYGVNAVRDGEWWLIEVPGIDGATQARAREDVPLMAREFIAVSTDIPLDEVAVVTVFDEAL